jgi:hypothetical protein
MKRTQSMFINVDILTYRADRSALVKLRHNKQSGLPSFGAHYSNKCNVTDRILAIFGSRRSEQLAMSHEIGIDLGCTCLTEMHFKL